MLHKLKITSYALIILLILVLPSQADEYCTTADMCAAAAQAAGKMLGNEGKNGITGYPFVLETNTYGCWYYPDSHANKNYAGSAFWGAASSEAQMRDPDPGAAHHVRLKCSPAAAEEVMDEIKAHNICDAKAKTYVRKHVNPRMIAEKSLTYSDLMRMARRGTRRYSPSAEAVADDYASSFNNCMAGGYYKFDPRWNNN